MEIIKLLGICLIVTVFCVLLKQYKPEYTFLVGILGGALVLVTVLGKITPAFYTLQNFLSSFSTQSFYFTTALKAVGIGYVTQFIADTCRDAGQSSIAAKAEFAGRSGIFLLSVPLLQKILEFAQQIL